MKGHLAHIEATRALLDHLFGPHSRPVDRERFRLAPEEHLREVSEQSATPLSSALVKFLALLLAEEVSASTEAVAKERRRSLDRLGESLVSLQRVYRSSLVMDAVMAFTGLVLVVLALISAFHGDVASSLVVGGMAVLDVGTLLWRKAVRQIEASGADLLRLRTVFSSFFTQIDQLGLRYEFAADETALAEKEAVAAEIHACATDNVWLIERCVKGTGDG